MEFECFKTFMVAHKVVYPFTFIHIITTCLHYGSTYLLVVTFDLGIKGAGLAILSTEIFNLVGILSMPFCFRNSLYTLQKRLKVRYIWRHVVKSKNNEEPRLPVYQNLITNNYSLILRIFCFLSAQFCGTLFRYSIC